MLHDLKPETRPSARREHASQGDDTFSISAAPIVPEQNGRAATDERALPRSYGLETLWLMARDPHSLFAYWDIDWRAAFGEENPKVRPVTLRLFDADGTEHAAMEVEPLAGHCQVEVDRADASYHAEIGFADSAGNWRVVSRSEQVFVPPATETIAEPGDFATVPMHLSFQRMVDAARGARAAEDQSLTDMLGELRQRAAVEQTRAAMTTEQGELVRALEQAAANQPSPTPRGSALPDLWKHYTLERILGFGNSSLNGGFGGSSRG